MPSRDVMARATACSNGVTPSACMMPPTLAAPVSSSTSTARLMYRSESRPWPSTRTTMSYLEALRAAFSPWGVRPSGLSIRRTRVSAEASDRATASVRSDDGPTATTTSSSPG